MKIKLIKLPGLNKWPINSTRILIPTIAIRGFFGHTTRIMAGFWVWQIHIEIQPTEAK